MNIKRMKRRNSYEKEFLEDRIRGCCIGGRNRLDDTLGDARVCRGRFHCRHGIFLKGGEGNASYEGYTPVRELTREVKMDAIDKLILRKLKDESCGKIKIQCEVTVRGEKFRTCFVLEGRKANHDIALLLQDYKRHNERAQCCAGRATSRLSKSSWFKV